MIVKISSKKHGIKEIIIDDDDYEKIKDYKWSITKRDNDKYYCITHEYRGFYKYGKIYLHRFIMNCDGNKIIDHINGNVFDNRKSNLRICTNKENCRNSKKPNIKTTSIYKGVCLDKRRNKYIARLMYNYKHVWLGYHKTEKEAALAYDRGAKKYFGEFANLNFGSI